MVSDSIPRLDVRPERLRIDWPDDVFGEFAALWLADNRAEDRHPNGQRLIDVMDLPDAVTIRSARIENDRVCVEFDGEWPAFERPIRWLRDLVGPLTSQRPELDRYPWLRGDALDAHRDFAWADHADFMAAAARRGLWLRRLARDGVAFLRGVPCREGEILSTCAAMGEVLQTNYGRLFDVRAVPSPENLAYTDVGLGLHTDNPYRDPVPGFQALHVLRASPDGGDSLFADGLALAEHLRRTDAFSFECLTRTPVTFHYRSSDADLCSEKPIIELAVDGAVRAVHYNNRSIAPLRLSVNESERFYAAYRAFARLLRDPSYAVRLRLTDGELVVFDNRRTLHGRTGFASQRHPRHLQGCYLTRDSVLSNAARLP
jgi:alpha-ketoglutarate-dependent taurine dioxygenase